MRTKSPRAPKHYVGCTLTEDGGVLRLRYRWQGKQRSKSLGVPATAENRGALEPLQRLVADALDRGRDPAPLIAECLRPGTHTSAAVEKPETVATYYSRWIAQQVPPLVRRAQRRDYRRHLTGYVLPVLGQVPLADAHGKRAPRAAGGAPHQRAPARCRVLLRLAAARRRGTCRSA